MINTISQEFIGQSIQRMNENTERIQICLRELSEDAVWRSPNEQSNSIGNLILHLCGNIRQYLVSGLGKKEDTRKRDEEFVKQPSLRKDELLTRLTNTVNEGQSIIQRFTADDLLQEEILQGFKLTRLGAILHVVEHYSYHTGQIAYWTKSMVNMDLRFYGDMDLNKLN